MAVAFFVSWLVTLTTSRSPMFASIRGPGNFPLMKSMSRTTPVSTTLSASGTFDQEGQRLTIGPPLPFTNHQVEVSRHRRCVNIPLHVQDVLLGIEPPVLQFGAAPASWQRLARW